MAALGNKIVLFGGIGADSGGHDTWENNTWAWDGNAWTQVAVTGPPTRQYAGMAAR